MVNVKRLVLKDFRNYSSLEADFSNGLNIFYGDNAQGKTNILESIYLSCTGRSFRTRDDRDLIRISSPFYRINCLGHDGDRDLKIQVICLSGNKKEIRLNGLPIRSYSELIGKIQTVVFTPDDLKLVKEGPSERRRFLDRELSLISTSYYYNLTRYNKVLKQRNQLLRELKNKDSVKSLIEPWNEQLCQYGAPIISARKKFIDEIVVYAEKIHSKISGFSETFKIEYLQNPKNINLSSYDTIMQGMQENLVNCFKMDVTRGTTSVGPHRDELAFFINDRNLQEYGSQGQMRSAALSLKLSEIEVVKKETGLYPIILLDDVMSELDVGRQNQLLEALNDLQVFMTITDLEGLDEHAVSRASVYRIQQGQVLNFSCAKEMEGV